MGVVGQTWTEADSEAFLEVGEAFVPSREEQTDAVSFLLHDVPDGRVLDLCCGGGGLSARILDDHPGLTVVGLDASATMRSRAGARLAGHGARFEAVEFDLGAADWRRHRGLSAVVSSLAVHHLTGAEKEQLYRDVFEMLAPGGRLVIADLVRPRGDRAMAYASGAWDRIVLEAGGEQAHQAFHELEWSWLQYPDELDKPSTVLEQLTWLEEIGYLEADVYWLRAGHAVFGGRKAER